MGLAVLSLGSGQVEIPRGRTPALPCAAIDANRSSAAEAKTLIDEPIERRAVSDSSRIDVHERRVTHFGPRLFAGTSETMGNCIDDPNAKRLVPLA